MFIVVPNEVFDAVHEGSENPDRCRAELAAWRSDFALLSDMEGDIAKIRAVIDNTDFMVKCIDNSFKNLSDEIFTDKIDIPGLQNLLDFESLTNEVKSRFDYSGLTEHLIYTGNFIDGLQKECADNISHYKLALTTTFNNNTVTDNVSQGIYT